MSPFRVPGVSQEVANMYFQIRGVDQIGMVVCVSDLAAASTMSSPTIPQWPGIQRVVGGAGCKQLRT